MCISVLLVLFAPPPFDHLPGPFDVREGDPPAAQALAALLGAGAVTIAFLCNFTVYALLYVYRQRTAVFTLVSIWMAGSIGVPFALLLLRCAGAWGVPLDGLSLLVATWNIAIPGTLLAWWHATRKRFGVCRRAHAGALAVLVSWIFAHCPYPTLIAILGLLACLDVLLVALPCCSPVQSLDKLYYARAREGWPAMPGLTFHDDGGPDGLFLGLGDFIVFSVFCSHAARYVSAAASAVIGIGLLGGLVVLMIHVALKWPLRALEPAMPLSMLCAALLLVIERAALRSLKEALAMAACSL